MTEHEHVWWICVAVSLQICGWCGHQPLLNCAGALISLAAVFYPKAGEGE